MKIQGERLFMETNGVRLHVVAAGPADGPLVILLHGFPDFWYGWRKQIGPLAAAGYRVLAPDQPGVTARQLLIQAIARAVAEYAPGGTAIAGVAN